MIKTTTGLFLLAALLNSAVPASAQTTSLLNSGFISVGAGGQPVSTTFTSDQTYRLYGEDAIITSEHDVSGGPYFEVGAGYRIWRSFLWGEFAVGAAFTSFSSSATAVTTGAIPDPAVFDSRHTLTQETSELDRSERGLHLQWLWLNRLSDSLDLTISLGPSFTWVSQDVATASSVANGTVNMTVTSAKESATAAGINMGALLTYMLNQRYGIGVQTRYITGSAGLDSGDAKAGGFQIGGGLQVRF